MAFGDSGCKLMALLLQFFSWMAKRISLSTNKALLTVLPALHSLPWAYDSQASDYHLNIFLFWSAARCSWRCSWASSYSWVRRPGCRHPSQACRSSRPVRSHNLSPDNHPGGCAPCSHCCLDLSLTPYRSMKHQEGPFNTNQWPFAKTSPGVRMLYSSGFKFKEK